ncbi:28563_t:CDS:2, partial [Racocetra persica]
LNENEVGEGVPNYLPIWFLACYGSRKQGVVSKEPIIDEYVVDKVCVKEKNDNRRMNDVTNMRSIINVVEEDKTKNRMK